MCVQENYFCFIEHFVMKMKMKQIMVGNQEVGKSRVNDFKQPFLGFAMVSGVYFTAV